MSTLAKKHFGQHFLSNQGVIDKIVSSVEALVDENTSLVEIGPGKGALTKALLKKGFQVVACEIDRDMVSELQQEFASEIESTQLKIHHGDFMKLDSSDLQKLIHEKECVITGNLPYNVGSQITFRILEDFDFATGGCVMLQKEVVEKFIAPIENRKDYGPPSVKFQWLANFKNKFWVSPGSFNPPPKVQSGVFSFSLKKDLENFSRPLSKCQLYQQSSSLIRKAFTLRRKKVKNSLGSNTPEEFSSKRPDEITPQDYILIAKLLKNS